MPRPIPQHANDFIERQLDERLEKLEEAFEADGIGFNGGMLFGVDDVLRTVVENLVRREDRRRRLVVILTSSGGYIEVVQRIVDTLRHHYDHVSFVIPNYAFSAGTVLALSGDEIHMDYYSRLGPIDPQVEAANGKMVPALGYLVQWERLLKKARNGTLTQTEAYLMVEGFDQAELYHYEQARELSVALLIEWLVKYKFKNWQKTATRGLTVTPVMRKKRAEAIARALNNTDRWHSHGHGISMAVLQRDLNIEIDDLDRNKDVCDRVKEYYSLLDDYMGKMGKRGVLHTTGTFVPYQ
jgi:hypothetical protein